MAAYNSLADPFIRILQQTEGTTAGAGTLKVNVSSSSSPSSPSPRQRVHVMNTQFYTKLSEFKLKSNEAASAAKAHKRVSRWTRGIDLFDSELVFVPINEGEMRANSTNRLPLDHASNTRHPTTPPPHRPTHTIHPPIQTFTGRLL